MMHELQPSAPKPPELEDPIPLSALQHAIYCLRQAALIHVERLWEENRFTAEGRVLHETAHDPSRRTRGGVRRVTALPLACRRLNLAGVADLVEFRKTGGGETAFPVEYKRGKPKPHRADEVQLCAQALCLEEMTGRPVPEGALFYGETKRRVIVAFDAELRAPDRGRGTGDGPHPRRAGDAQARLPRRSMPRLLAHRSLPSQGARPVRARLSRRGDRGGAQRRRRMKKLLNTLYVTTEGAALRKDGDNLVAEVEGTERARVPFHMLSSLVVFGGIFISPPLIEALAPSGVTIVLLDRVGRFRARVEGPVSGNVLLRRAQYRASDKPEPIVVGFVSGKIANQRAVLQRGLRDHGEAMALGRRAALEAAVERLARILRRVTLAPLDLDALRGAEGEAAQIYFSAFDALIRVDDTTLHFTGRSRRPPLDPINALLSFLYTLLTHDCRSAAEAVGLDPAVGFLHRERPGRPSLALDLMEELRPVLADRLALSLINRRQIGPDDFEWREGGAVLLAEAGRRTVLAAWQERKREERRHAFMDETAPLGLVPYIQAQLLARHLRGDLDGYPPWIWS